MSWNISTTAKPAELKLALAPNRDIPEGLKAVVYGFCDRQPRRDVIVSLYTYGQHKEDAVHVGHFDLRVVHERRGSARPLIKITPQPGDRGYAKPDKVG